MANAWLIWWLTLCAMSALNVCAWVVSARMIRRTGLSSTAADDTLRRSLLWLSAVYVLGCAFRSLLPMSDVPRMCLHDTWVSRIFIGRSVATIAELCFVAQWALLLGHAAAVTRDRLALLVSRALVPMIAVAELASWGAVLTTNYALHAIENSLWTFAAALALVAIAFLRSSLDAAGRRFAVAAIICSTTYIAFMTTVDVPMWLARWHAEPGGLLAGVSLAAGLRTTLQRCVVTREWAAWRDDVPWLSLYFTVAVWISIALAHVPPLHAAAAPQLRRTRAPLPADR